MSQRNGRPGGASHQTEPGLQAAWYLRPQALAKKRQMQLVERVMPATDLARASEVAKIVA